MCKMIMFPVFRPRPLTLSLSLFLSVCLSFSHARPPEEAGRKCTAVFLNGEYQRDRHIINWRAYKKNRLSLSKIVAAHPVGGEDNNKLRTLTIYNNND